MDPTKKYKIIMLGDSQVGKTSILHMYQKKHFNQSHISTIGLDFITTKYTTPEGHSATVMLWDTAGQERFKNITYSFYKNADGVIVTYDVTSEESFRNVKSWLISLY